VEKAKRTDEAGPEGHSEVTIRVSCHNPGKGKIERGGKEKREVIGGKATGHWLALNTVNLKWGETRSDSITAHVN